MKKRTIFLILILFSLFLNSCKYDFILPEVVPPIDNGGEPISFSTQVAPIFSTGNKCTACHKPGDKSPDLTAANAFAQLVPNHVNTASPESSKIYTVAKSGTHYASISASQAAIILLWITEGAKDN
ncbi:MAG: hypothetical protein K0M40_05705 [Prolixibacteraceae bacterium]|nr:hypothetical protein [Prolixibacteraceae bacterium]